MPERFTIHVDDDVLDDLRDRLRHHRSPDDPGNGDWTYGVPSAYLDQLVDHWAHHFDWRAVERSMNDLEHWRATVEDQTVHFVRAPGVGPDPLPIILTHGWPWTFWDYRAVIGPLSDPGAHGGDPDDAFDVIVPSLPGYGFSTPLARTGIGYRQVASLWHRLMTEVLGFERYAAGGGDSGAFVSAHLAHLAPAELVGVHLTFPALMGFDYASLVPEDFGPDDAGGFEQCAYGAAAGHAHMAVHITDPQTLAHALADSPAGLAAWMVERRRSWSDCGGDVESVFSRDDLCTSFSLYWLTDTVASSLRMYPESFREPWTPVREGAPIMSAPTAIAQFPRELAVVPPEVVARTANLVHHTRMPRGGHFAPAEQPELVVADIRAAFRGLR